MSNDSMKNSTYGVTETSITQEAAVNRLHQLEWMLAELFNIFAIASLLWLTVSFFVYGLRTGKWEKAQVNNPVQVNAGSVYTAAVVSLIITLTHFLTGQVAFNLGYHDQYPYPCEAVMDATIITYKLTIISVNAFLWFRQRSLYQHPASKSFQKPWLFFVSWSSLLIIICGSSVAGFFFVKPSNYRNSRKGCISKPRKAFIIWPVYLCYAVVLFGQSMMIFLFCQVFRFPLGTRIVKRLTSMMKRSAILAVICASTDLLVTVLYIHVIPPQSTRHVTLTAYDLNLFVNVVVVVLSFDTWKVIVVAPVQGGCKKAKKKSVSTTTQTPNTQFRGKSVMVDTCDESM